MNLNDLRRWNSIDYILDAFIGEIADIHVLTRMC